jgi:hypothetical protein
MCNGPIALTLPAIRTGSELAGARDKNRSLASYNHHLMNNLKAP